MKCAKTVVCLSLGVLGGCNLAPKYERPEAPVPAQWPAYPATQPTTQAVVDPALLNWREFFTDEKLQRLIEMALENNRDLRLAALNVERAQGLYGIQRAEGLPVVDAAASMNRQRVPGDVAPGGRAVTASTYSANLGVSWEIDFFGRIRNLTEAALQEYLGTEQARRSVQILLVSNVANAYLTLAADRENLKLAQSTLEAQLGSYNLVRKRLDQGVVPEVDLYRAQTQVETARGDVARLTQQVALDENALNLLVGAPVAAELLPVDLSHIAPLTEIAAGVSSEALLLRPDILQAENQLRAAYANIGAARAVLFPRISLTAFGGTASDELSGLFNGSNRAWSFTPQAVMPIFDARAWSAVKVSKVDREIAVTQYERAIQTGFREVADALAIRATVGLQVAAQESLVRAVAETYRLSTARYDKGLDSYLDVLDAQRTLYSAQEGLISLHLARLANQVRLYAVLGGGWQEPAVENAEQPADGKK